jgi:biopolymer transport protein ExbD
MPDAVPSGLNKDSTRAELEGANLTPLMDIVQFVFIVF